LLEETVVCSFIHSYLSEFPVKELSHKARKTYDHCPQSPTRKEGLHTLGAPWFPKGIVDGCTVGTPVPCSLQHDAFHLSLGRPEPG
jgi:hypothetical protein